MIEIHGLTKEQVKIADLLWSCDSLEEVEYMVESIGKEAEVIRDLLLLASIDEEVSQMNSYPEATKLLSKFFA